MLLLNDEECAALRLALNHLVDHTTDETRDEAIAGLVLLDIAQERTENLTATLPVA